MTALKKTLTLDTAKKLADAIEKAAIKHNITLVMSIFDNHGNLKYFRRMDNTSYGSIRISQLKAKTAASLPLTSRALGDRSANMPANPYSAQYLTCYYLAAVFLSLPKINNILVLLALVVPHQS